LSRSIWSREITVTDAGISTSGVSDFIADRLPDETYFGAVTTSSSS
jgi:hypothetical protein